MLEHEITVVIPSMGENLLLIQTALPCLKRSMTVPHRIIVILNKANWETCKYLIDEEVEFIALTENFGPGATDFAIPMMTGKYVVNVNDDMLFHPGWDVDLIKVMDEFYPCTASCGLVERTGPFIVDNLGDFTEPQVEQKFLSKVLSGEYAKVAKRRVCGNHPIMCRTEDYIGVKGYSNGFDEDWIKTVGLGLDDHFIYRLWRRLGKDFRPIQSASSFVYHASNLTIGRMRKRASPREVFRNKTGMTIEAFNEEIENWTEI